MAHHAKAGRIKWIGTRPQRLARVAIIESVILGEDGLRGDHARPGKRAVTLIQAEHLPVIAALAGLDTVAPEALRRNVVVAGINLTAMRNHHIQLGNAVIEITAPCAPCSRMEAALGQGGYNAMRGHGGWCARVVTPGRVAVGDIVTHI
ncbi:MAG: MOSC domain-containing protein [Pseudomonadota bacterium]